MAKLLQGRVLNIGTYAGIPVRIHWTFGFLLLFVGYVAIVEHLDFKTSFFFLIYVLILFLCVTLHEYGHALMGRKYGVHTGEILLTPIGGIAKMGEMTNKPKHEFLIALAGPLVNVLIATILGIFIYYYFDAQFFPTTDDYSIFSNPADLLRMVFLLNIILFVFNLIPAYPMDGGRVLRSLIAMKTGFNKATIIATNIGMIFSLGFIGLAIYMVHPTLGLIGVFIFTMANKERKYAQRDKFILSAISKYINRNYTLINESDNLDKYYPIINDKTQVERDFLVISKEQEITGTLPMVYLTEAYNARPAYQQVREFMRPTYGSLDESTSIRDVAKYMNTNGYYIIAITKNNKLIGTVTRNLIRQLYGDKN